MQVVTLHQVKELSNLVGLGLAPIWLEIEHLRNRRVRIHMVASPNAHLPKSETLDEIAEVCK
jgi:hypothetical protein